MTSQATHTPCVWIGCIAAYNNGRLHGEWFDISDDADDNAANIAKILRSSPCPNTVKTDEETGETYATADEAFCADYDNIPKALADMLGEYPTAQALADAVRLVEALESHFRDEEDAAIVLGAMIDHDSSADLSDLADDASGWISEHFAGKADTLRN